MPSKNNNSTNIIVTIKDLNQPNYSIKYLLPNQMTHLINNNSNNIPAIIINLNKDTSINMINIDGNKFCLLSHINKFLTFLK